MSIQATAGQSWATYDSDDDGNISLEESKPFFETLIAKRADLGLTADNHAAWFAGIDKNADGSISKEEMVEYLTSINYQA